MAHDATLAAATTVSVVLAPALIRLFPDCIGRLDLAASNVSDMLDELDARWPGMRDRLHDSTPRIRRHISVFVDGHRSTLDTPLQPGTKVYILTMVSGG